MLNSLFRLFRHETSVVSHPKVRHYRKASGSCDQLTVKFDSLMKHSFTVCVEGNIASGKTRLLQYFKKFSGIVEILEEPTQKWRDIQGLNALAKMYEDPERWGAIFQSYSQLTMTHLHTKPHMEIFPSLWVTVLPELSRASFPPKLMEETNSFEKICEWLTTLLQTCPVKLMERSLHSGRYCFIENLHKSKVMADLEYVVLTQWFDLLTKSHDIKVDLIVYLRTRPEVVLERVKTRLRPEEQCIPLKYLEDLHDLHEDWLIKKTTFQPPAPVLVLDANQDLPSMYKIFEEEKAKILFGLAPS